MKQNIIFFGASSSIASELIKYYSDDKSNSVYAFSQNKINFPNIRNYSLKYDDKSLNRVKDLIKDIDIDIVFISNGFLSNKFEDLDKLYEINSLIPIKLTKLVLDLNPKKCKFVFFDSPSSIRGRKSTFLYGAAKASLKIFCEGLRHKYASTHPNIKFYNPIIHPTISNMTNHIKSKTRMSESGETAKLIVKFIDRNKFYGHLTLKWALIMFIIRIIPNNIFNKINI